MKIRNVLQCSVIFAVVLSAVFGISLENAFASEMKMRQQILPVRFVYLEKNGNIDHIWSNVTERDEQCVVKFFDKKQKEVEPTQVLLKAYQKSMSMEDKKTVQLDKTVYFNEKEELLEEVYTVV